MGITNKPVFINYSINLKKERKFMKKRYKIYYTEEMEIEEK